MCLLLAGWRPLHPPRTTNPLLFFPSLSPQKPKIKPLIHPSILYPSSSATGSTTNGGTAEAACGFVKAGFYAVGTTATVCPANTYSGDVRAVASAPGCTSW